MSSSFLYRVPPVGPQLLDIIPNKLKKLNYNGEDGWILTAESRRCTAVLFRTRAHLHNNVLIKGA